MNKYFIFLPLSLLALTSCLSSNKTTTNTGGSQTSISISDTPSIPSIDIDDEFSLTSSTGQFSVENKIYTITSSGTFILSGSLSEGQIVVNAPTSAEVVLDLSGVSISYSNDAPIKINSADKVEISAKSGTSNLIEDLRSPKSVEDVNAGEGAISAKCDLKFKGAGVLVVKGGYNNGIHSTKDLSIQKLDLYVEAYNNAVKGKDSISMTSGNVTAISKNDNGLKTDNSDISSKSVQRGIIAISGGTLSIDCPHDAIDASYNIVINEDNSEDLDTDITLKTGDYSTYKDAYVSSYSSKGLKANNEINIAGGNITIQASDDAIHADYGTSLSNGSKGQGNVNISKGKIIIASGDDGIHADNTLSISGGSVYVKQASEGLESNHIKISGGSTIVNGTDDGVNASKKINQTPTIEISDGYLDVTVSSGDTDGIDSNGTFTMSGGFVVTRGAHGTSGGMSTGLDCDSTAQITGGTFISFNGVEKTPNKGTDVLYAYYGETGSHLQPGPGGFKIASSSTFAAGVYTLTGDDFSKTFENIYTYSAFLIYSSELVLNSSYVLKCGESSVLSWSQSSSTTQIK